MILGSNLTQKALLSGCAALYVNLEQNKMKLKMCTYISASAEQRIIRKLSNVSDQGDYKVMLNVYNQRSVFFLVDVDLQKSKSELINESS